jgi:hypothetical protein
MLQKVGTELKPALAYLRRGYGVAQRSAIHAFAAGAGFEIVAELTAALEAGASEGSLAFAIGDIAKLLLRIDIDAVRAVIVSTASLIGETPTDRVVCYERLRQRGVELIAADAPDAFKKELNAHAHIKETVAVIDQFDSAAAAAARDAASQTRRARTGKPHRKTYAELAPEATLMAKRLHQSAKMNGERITLREISAKLAAVGFVQDNRKPFHPEVIRRMLKGKWPRNRAPQ